ncbi:PAS domain-containing protein [Vibrio hannami]|uniref:PAS domain-containing protein n=1 Tax=Vibrio hannami TaxID=2717094 RepID=UPI00240F4DB7|nr:PAS domain-containing protein [Vibrio hannami]MDG3088788.1 PAS domain-containing protein [Vibrio hannami]
MDVGRETYIDTRTHCMDLGHDEKMVQSLDFSGTILDVSPAWLTLTGYVKDEVVGRHFMEFLDVESLLCVEKNFPQLKDFGYIDNVSLKIRCKDAAVITVTLNGTSKYSQKGTFERTFCEITPTQKAGC